MNKGENLRFNGSTLNFLGGCCANVPILFGDFTRHREMMMSTKGFNNKMIFWWDLNDRGEWGYFRILDWRYLPYIRPIFQG